MTEYNLKGTYEPGSLDEVVGEVKIIDKTNKKNVWERPVNETVTALIIVPSLIFNSVGLAYVIYESLVYLK